VSFGVRRDEILQRFEQWLDTAMADEGPPSGIDLEILSAIMQGEDRAAERRCDDYALWEATTALSQEIKLQGRAFKDLTDALRARDEGRGRELVAEAERRCRKQAVSVLIDLRDRMARGLESVRAAEAAGGARRGMWARLFPGHRKRRPADTAEALAKGYELVLERLDQALEEWDVREIRCQGEAFDPRRMYAAAKEESGDVPDGTVLEVYRTGYEWNGGVFRSAQVKVSRAGLKKEPHD
jgi:molecular chaperone GrpE